MKKIAIVYGTRPELLKLIPLILKMDEHPFIKLTVINTGQHLEMVEEIERTFNILPDIRLKTMTHNQSLTDILVNVAKAFEAVIMQHEFDLVIVQGDTSTASTVSLICFYNKIKIAHVEAGLRSHNLEEPYPEEFNRRLISVAASFNFAPTQLSYDNLINEGIPGSKVRKVGNTIVDMVNIVKKGIDVGLGKSFPKKILVTLHRRENHATGITNVCKAVRLVLDKYPDLEFVWPVHPNPNVLRIVNSELGNTPNVKLTKPLNYLELIKEISECLLVWSDSGGIQEECPSFKKPVLILRDVTERPEVLLSGFGVLMGTNVDKIVSKTLELIEDKSAYERMISGEDPFGDGTASEKILTIVLGDDIK